MLALQLSHWWVKKGGLKESERQRQRERATFKYIYIYIKLSSLHYLLLFSLCLCLHLNVQTVLNCTSYSDSTEWTQCLIHVYACLISLTLWYRVIILSGCRGAVFSVHSHHRHFGGVSKSQHWHLYHRHLPGLGGFAHAELGDPEPDDGLCRRGGAWEMYVKCLSALTLPDLLNCS